MPRCQDDPDFLAFHEFPHGTENCEALRAAFVRGFRKSEEVHPGWKCFHCGQFFTERDDARVHFGNTPSCRPGCTLHVDDVGTLRILRDVENERNELFVRLEAQRHGADENAAIARWRASQNKKQIEGENETASQGA